MLDKLAAKLNKKSKSSKTEPTNDKLAGDQAGPTSMQAQQQTPASLSSADGETTQNDAVRTSHHTPFSSKPVTYPYKDADGQPLADPYAKWGVEQRSAGPEKLGRTAEDVPPDHPVHAMSPEKQEKLKKKGVNPVLKAEMDHMFEGEGKDRKGFGGYLSRKMATAGWGTPGVDGGGM